MAFIPLDHAVRRLAQMYIYKVKRPLQLGFVIILNVAILFQPTFGGLPPEDEQYVKDREFAAANLKKVKGRFVIDGEMYDPVCNCKPPPPDHSKQCYPSKVTITKDSPIKGKLQPPGRLVIDGKNLRKLIGDPSDLRMAHKFKHFASDVDGRSSDEIFGVWGGEFGEMILMLSIYESENLAKLGVAITPFQLQMAVLNYIRSCAARRQFFYFHSDTDAAAFIENELGEGEIDITNPPEKYKKKLLDILKKPQSMGSRHVKMMMMHPAKYEVRKSMIEGAITAFYNLMWEPGSEVREKIKYYILHAPKINGMPNEVAFVKFKVGDLCSEESLQPLFPPWSNGVSVYLHHPQVAQALHQAAALAIKASQGGLADAAILTDKISERYETWDLVTKELLPEMAGLPVFNVLIEADFPATEAPEAGSEPDEDAPVNMKLYHVGQLDSDK